MLDVKGVNLLRMLIHKMWSLNEARHNGDCQSIADEINAWMPEVAQCVEAWDVAKALGRSSPEPVVNVDLLRDQIDALPQLYSARLNGDYQAILNEVRLLPELGTVNLVDVIEAMASRPVPQPEYVVQAAAKLVGKGSSGPAKE